MSTDRRLFDVGAPLGIVVIGALACATCGGSAAAPSAATPTTPRTTFTIDQPADNFDFSSPLRPLGAGQVFDLVMTVVQINRADTETFAHSVDFWLSPDGTQMPSAATSTRIGVSWASGSQWAFLYRLPQSSSTIYTGVRLTIQTGTQHAVRIARGLDGSAQLSMDGVNLGSVADADSAPTLFVQVVGLRVDFAY